jgi:hypothetical protein
MKTKYLKLFSLCLLLSSCRENYDGKPAPAVDAVSHPAHVCDFSDGRVLYRIVVQKNSAHDHYVYFFKNKNDASVVTTNTSVPNGKTRRNSTTVQVPE